MKWLPFFQNLSKLVPDTSIDKVVIGSNNGMAPNKRQPITSTNDDKILRNHMATLGWF